MDLSNILTSPKRVFNHSNPTRPPSTTSRNTQQTRQRTLDAIDSATPERVRAVLKKIVCEHPDGGALVSQELLLRRGQLKAARVRNRAKGGGNRDGGGDDAEEEEDESSDYSDADGGDDDDVGQTGGKRKAPFSRQRFEVCVQCEQEYDVLLNGPESCQWHDGEDEVDDQEDFWADHDEDCHGVIDTPEMRKEFPEGFRWTCCDQLGTDKGCRITPHRPDRSKRVRR